MTPLLIAAAIVLALVAFTGLSLAEWRRFSTVLGASGPVRGPAEWFCSVTIGSTHLRSCVVLTHGHAGLGVRCMWPWSLFAPPLSLPWADLAQEDDDSGLIRVSTLHLRSVPQFSMRLATRVLDRVAQGRLA
jgi:hypothetical protein